MKLVPFSKLTSFGNNFVIVDETHGNILSEIEKSDFAYQATNINFGVGSDNFLIVQSCTPETMREINRARGYWDTHPDSESADFIFRMFEPDGTILKEYLYAGQIRMAMVDTATGTLYYYANNHLGAPILMIDSNGMVAWEAEYRPFGEADVNPHSEIENNFRLPGQYHDAETGLNYNYHRYYHLSTGRYLRADPSGLSVGINLYAYAENNPVTFIDPLGLMSETSEEAVRAIMSNPNLSPQQKRDIIRNIPMNLPDPNIINPYLNNDFDLSKFPMDEFIEKIVKPADEMIRSIPPGQGTGYPPADIGLNLYQIIRELYDKLRYKQDRKNSYPCEE